LPTFYSQSGEDRILAELFKGKADGHFVEVGAFNGVAHSNSYYFEQLGWSGVLVEANPILAQECRESRPRSKIFAGAVVRPGSPATVTFEIAADPALSSLAITRDMLRRVPGRAISRVTVPAKTLDEVLEESGLQTIDFMTIDVEGHEFEVLQGLSLGKWRPRIVILERNTHFPDRRIMRCMHTAGYLLERTTGVNDWFILASVEASHNPRYLTRLFMRYYLPKLITAWRPLVRTILLSARILR
jgi:FkbM family methyltransferase